MFVYKKTAHIQDILDMMYMEEEVMNWAIIGMDDDAEKPRDVNGVELKKVTT